MPTKRGRMWYFCAAIASCGLLAAGLPAQPQPTDVAPAATPTKSASPTADDHAAVQEVVLLLKGGREVTGLLDHETEDEIILRIEGITTPFDKSQVRSMRVLPPLIERYAAMRKLVDDDDLDGRLLLVEWLRTREQYGLALTETQAILARDPYSRRAKELEKWLEQQIELNSEKHVAPEDGDAGESGRNRFAAREKAKDEFPLLKPEDINLIKVYEVDLSDPPQMLIPREVIDQLIQTYAASPLIPATVEGREALYRKPPPQILELMFRLQARELYSKVTIRDHPKSLQLFRTKVHARWLVSSCATAQCHGGKEAGRLWLHNDRPNSDETVYTNLLILERFKLADGTPLIDYAQPAKSPLLQMGLDRKISLYPHPPAPRTRGSRGWRQIFRGPDDPRFRDAIEWISSMYQPRPDYPIDYTPPTPSAAEAEPSPDR